MVNVTIQSIEKDGEEYLKKLMYYYSNHNFKIINGSYKRESVIHDRLGNNIPYYLDVIRAELNLERIVKDIHSPSDYIKNKLHSEIYEIFDSFRNYIIPNDDKLDYVFWINEYWCKVNEN